MSNPAIVSKRSSSPQESQHKIPRNNFYHSNHEKFVKGTNKKSKKPNNNIEYQKMMHNIHYNASIMAGIKPPEFIHPQEDNQEIQSRCYIPLKCNFKEKEFADKQRTYTPITRQNLAKKEDNIKGTNNLIKMAPRENIIKYMSAVSSSKYKVCYNLFKIY